MKIGLLTTSFPRFDGDIAGDFVRGFACAFGELGHEIQVLAPEPAHGEYPPAFTNVSVQWVPYMRPRRLACTFYGAGVPDNLRRHWLAWLGLPSFGLALAHAARKSAPHWDAMVSHWALPCAPIAGGLRRGRPHLAVFHSADVHLLLRLPARRQLAQYIAEHATAMLFTSSVLREAFLDCLHPVNREDVAGRSQVSPMGIEPVGQNGAFDCDDREALRRKLGFDRFTVVCIARLVPVKGVDIAVRSLANRDDVDLVVVGDGPERAKLYRLARRENVRVRFLGTVVGERKRELLQAADAFVSCSRVLASGRTEGTPIALLEALAQGLPIIATDVGGVADAVQHGHSALLIPPSQPEALRLAIDRLLHDRQLRVALGQKARAAADRFAWPRLARQFESMLMG